MKFEFLKNKFFVLFIFFLTILPIDQLSKAWARNNLETPKLILDKNIGFALTSNSGSAFSLFSNSTIFVTILATIIITILIVAYFRSNSGLLTYAYAVIAVGASGNLLDRFFQPPYNGHGHVTDFIKIFSWPTFNVADMVVSLGAAMLLVSAFFVRGKENG
ncbi:MAG: signal peptidase II [Acidimicrobiia bacterium]